MFYYIILYSNLLYCIILYYYCAEDARSVSRNQGLEECAITREQSVQLPTGRAGTADLAISAELKSEDLTNNNDDNNDNSNNDDNNSKTTTTTTATTTTTNNNNDNSSHSKLASSREVRRPRPSAEPRRFTNVCRER